MAFAVPSKVKTQKNIDDEDEFGDQPQSITRHLSLKSPNGSGKLEKEHVIRRIRHRRRMNKARSFLHKILGSISGSGEKVSAHEKKWLDDDFSAP